MNGVTSNDAASYGHLATLFDGLAISKAMTGDIFDRDVTTAVCNIAIYGTKSEVYVCDVGHICKNLALDEDAAAAVRASRRIARDGAVGECERAIETVDAAAPIEGGAIASRCVAGG
jgi:hypothetical protein